MIVAVVVSLAISAALGIAAVLGGEFGELQGRILFSTLVVAAFGTTSLCHLAVVARSVRSVGFTGVAVSLGAAACALVLIWDDRSAGEPDASWWKALGVLGIAAFSLAQANLLLLLAAGADRAVRGGLVVTLIAVTGVAVLCALPVLTDGRIPGPDDEPYLRSLAVLGILDALGTIALPVLGLVLRRRAPIPAPAADDAPETVRLVLELPAELAGRLDERGGSRETAAVAALAEALAGSPGRGPTSGWNRRSRR